MDTADRATGLTARRWLASATQIAVCLAFSQWHLLARFLVAGETTEASGNAMQLIDVERALGMYHEAAVQHFVVARPLLADAATLIYSLGHAVVPVWALVALWRSNRERYRYWRNVLAVMCVLALGGFALWPLMPPRLLPQAYGFTDLVAEGPVVDLGRPIGPALYNGYAAMPSLHMGFAMWASLALFAQQRSRVWRAVLVAYPVVMTLAVVATGNHYVLDVVGGGIALGAAVALVSRGMKNGDPTFRPACVNGHRSARGAQLALVALIVLVWLPKAQFATAALDALVVVGVESCLRLDRLKAARSVELLPRSLDSPAARPV